VIGRVTCGAVTAALVAAAALAGLAAAAPAAKPLSADMLGAMVLPRELLAGGRFDLLPPSTTNGEMEVEDAVRYTLDPADDGADMVDAGWIGGWDQSWGPGFASDGTFFGGTNVQLFQTAGAATLDHVRQIESFRLFRGKLIEGGWTLDSTTSWKVPSLGSDAWAIANVFKSKAGTFYDTEIHLRLGRLVGEVGLISSHNTSLRKAVEDDGRTLLARMKRVAGASK
jgi:hypothetical protein